MNRKTISASLFIALLALFAASAFYATFEHKLIQKLGQKEYGIINSELFATFETEFKEVVAYNDPLLHGWGALQYGAFNAGKSGVVIGEDEWLFTKEEFEKVEGFDANVRANLAFIAHAAQQLQEEGVELIILPLPSKARVYADRLGDVRAPHYHAGLYGKLVWHLNNHALYHINVNDLFALYKDDGEGDLFMRTDTHWSQRGAKLTAQAVRSFFIEGLTYSMDFETVRSSAKIDKSQSETYRGDLTEFVSTGGWHAQVGPKSEKLHKVLIEKSVSGGGDLFGEQVLPIALVGTSYSAESEWHFADFLAAEFNAEIWNRADPGEGPFTPMQKFLNEKSWEQNGVKLVLWEIPERFLPVDYELNVASNEEGAK